MRDAIALDMAHLAHDGTAPLCSAISAIIKQAHADIYVDAVAIGEAAKAVIKEDGEAHLALFIAAQPGATAKQLREAQREIEEASVAQMNALATICTAIEHREHPPP